MKYLEYAEQTWEKIDDVAIVVEGISPVERKSEGLAGVVALKAGYRWRCSSSRFDLSSPNL